MSSQKITQTNIWIGQNIKILEEIIISISKMFYIWVLSHTTKHIELLNRNIDFPIILYIVITGMLTMFILLTLSVLQCN